MKEGQRNGGKAVRIVGCTDLSSVKPSVTVKGAPVQSMDHSEAMAEPDSAMPPPPVSDTSMTETVPVQSMDDDSEVAKARSALRTCDGTVVRDLLDDPRQPLQEAALLEACTKEPGAIIALCDMALLASDDATGGRERMVRLLSAYLQCDSTDTALADDAAGEVRSAPDTHTYLVFSLVSFLAITTLEWVPPAVKKECVATTARAPPLTADWGRFDEYAAIGVQNECEVDIENVGNNLEFCRCIPHLYTVLRSGDPKAITELTRLFPEFVATTLLRFSPCAAAVVSDHYACYRVHVAILVGASQYFDTTGDMRAFELFLAWPRLIEDRFGELSPPDHLHKAFYRFTESYKLSNGESVSYKLSNGAISVVFVCKGTQDEICELGLVQRLYRFVDAHSARICATAISSYAAANAKEQRKKVRTSAECATEARKLANQTKKHAYRSAGNFRISPMYQEKIDCLLKRAEDLSAIAVERKGFPQLPIAQEHTATMLYQFAKAFHQCQPKGSEPILYLVRLVAEPPCTQVGYLATDLLACVAAGGAGSPVRKLLCEAPLPCMHLSKFLLRLLEMECKGGEVDAPTASLLCSIAKDEQTTLTHVLENVITIKTGTVDVRSFDTRLGKSDARPDDTAHGLLQRAFREYIDDGHALRSILVAMTHAPRRGKWRVEPQSVWKLLLLTCTSEELSTDAGLRDGLRALAPLFHEEVLRLEGLGPMKYVRPLLNGNPGGASASEPAGEESVDGADGKVTVRDRRTMQARYNKEDAKLQKQFDKQLAKPRDARDALLYPDNKLLGELRARTAGLRGPQEAMLDVAHATGLLGLAGTTGGAGSSSAAPLAITGPVVGGGAIVSASASKRSRKRPMPSVDAPPKEKRLTTAEYLPALYQWLDKYIVLVMGCDRCAATRKPENCQKRTDFARFRSELCDNPEHVMFRHKAIELVQEFIAEYHVSPAMAGNIREHINTYMQTRHGVSFLGPPAKFKISLAQPRPSARARASFTLGAPVTEERSMGVSLQLKTYMPKVEQVSHVYGGFRVAKRAREEGGSGTTL